MKSGFCQHAVSSIQRNLALIFFFFPYLKSHESPRNSALLSQSLSILRRGGGRGGGGMEVPASPGAGLELCPLLAPLALVAASSWDPGTESLCLVALCESTVGDRGAKFN